MFERDRLEVQAGRAWPLNRVAAHTRLQGSRSFMPIARQSEPRQIRGWQIDSSSRAGKGRAG